MLNVKTIKLDEGKDVTLRLTSKALCAFIKSHGVQDAPVMVSILSAIDNLESRIGLFTKALNHTDNKNTVKDGETLLDYLADLGYNRSDVNRLIMELAQEAGLVTREEMDSLLEAAEENGSNTLNSMVRLLKGEKLTPDIPGAEGQTEAKGNPT